MLFQNIKVKIVRAGASAVLFMGAASGLATRGHTLPQLAIVGGCFVLGAILLLTSFQRTVRVYSI